MDIIKEMADRGVGEYGAITVPKGAHGVGIEITKGGEIMRLSLASKNPITSPQDLDGVAMILKDWATEKLAS